MKILIVVQRYFPSIGGTQKLAKGLAENLVRAGHKVTVVTSDSLNQQDLRGYSFTKGFRHSSINNNLNFEETVNGVEIIRFHPFLQVFTYMFNPGMYTWLSDNINQYDVVHTFCYMFAEPDMVASLKRQNSKWKFIIQPNDVYIPNNANRILSTIKKIYDQTIGKNTLAKADKVIMLTNEGRKQLETFYKPHKSQLTIIPPGIDMPDKIHVKRNKNQIVFVGRYVEYKGAQYILQALKFLKDKNLPQLKAVFIGNDQGYLHTLKDISHNLRIDNIVTFYEDIDDKELHRLYAQSEYFILPSSNEGFGMVAVEAASYGCKPILLNAGGLAVISKNLHCHVIDPNGSIASQIAKIILRQEKVKKNKKRIKFYKNYLWEPTIIAKYENVYAET